MNRAKAEAAPSTSTTTSVRAVMTPAGPDPHSPDVPPVDSFYPTQRSALQPLVSPVAAGGARRFETLFRTRMPVPPLKSTVLMYHDVVEPGGSDASGFPGAGPARYKLEWKEFLEHLDALERVTTRGPDTVEALIERRTDPGSWSLTFDDGGSSALRIGEQLAGRGWRGHFFVTTDFIGTPGFLTAGEIERLSEMGHVIGSHSCSHPRRMSSCSPSQLLHEWSSSVDVLSEIVGRRVSAASLPGGYYASSIAKAAHAAGITVLYTSEPERTARSSDGCLVIGRYPVLHGMPPARVADVVLGRRLPWLRRRASWGAAKVAKAVGGELYPKARAALLERRGGAPGQGR